MPFQNSAKYCDCGKRSSIKCVKNRLPDLFTKQAFLMVWLTFSAITISHYTASPHIQWIHDLLRRAYYFPIVIAAMRAGKVGGLFFTVIVTLVYIPHAFFDVHHMDPAHGLEKSLEIALYFVVAGTAGYLSDQECRRRTQLQTAMDEQKNLSRVLVRAGRLAALGEVVAGIAHEIKNPLHSLSGTAEIVDPEIAKESPVRRMWEIHKNELERLKRTAEQFLSFARPSLPVLAKLDLRDVAKRLTDLVNAEAGQKNITLETVFPNSPVWVDGDTDQIAQVGLNITLNAIKAIGQNGGTIKIIVAAEHSPTGTFGLMRVENDGPLIPEAEKEHLFDPFHSGNDGTGLGLSISVRIVRQLDGFIDVDDAGLGTSFTVHLPLTNETNDQ